MITNPNLAPRIATACCAAFALLAGITLISALSEWRNDWIIAHQTTPTANATDTTSNKIAAIPNDHLFGASSNDVPISSLQLRVTGIVKYESEDIPSKAYISISGQPSKIYQSGDSLPYGVKVYDIQSNAVILENNGRLEKLPLARPPLQFKPSNTGEHL